MGKFASREGTRVDRVIDSVEPEDFYYMNINVPCQGDGRVEGVEFVRTRPGSGGVDGKRSASFSHLYSPCVTFDKQFETWDHLKEWTHPLPENHSPSDLKQAMNEAHDDPFSLGILYTQRGS